MIRTSPVLLRAFGEYPNWVDQIQTPGSEIGFKGEERLGGSLAVWFQCATTFDFRAQNGDGLCRRNSAIGFKGNFGNIFGGTWDTPFKRALDLGRVGQASTGIFGSDFLFAGNSTTTDGRATPDAFKRRQASLFTYESPRFAGFQLMGAVTANGPTGGGIGSAQTDNVQGVKPRLYSVAATYTNGPINAGLSGEVHKNFRPGGGLYAGTDYGLGGGLNYTFLGRVKVGGAYMYREFDQNAAGAQSRIHTWQVGADWKIAGPHGLRGGWTHAGKVKGGFGTAAAPVQVGSNLLANGNSGNTSAELYQIQYYYVFSKRTEAAVGYVFLDNDDSARYSLGGYPKSYAGEHQQGIGVSVRHTF